VRALGIGVLVVFRGWRGILQIPRNFQAGM
jgi:hypothetical protein